MDVDPAPKSGASSMIPVALGILGIALGAVGLFTALSKSSDATTKLDALTKKVDELSTTVQTASASAQDASTKAMRQTQDLADLRNQVQTNLGQMIQAINADREELKKQHDVVEALTSRAPAGGRSGGAAAGATTTAVAGQGGTHVIKSGDLLGNLAKQYGVSVQAIVDANPGVNPNNLKVGTSIKIPAAKAASSAPAAGGAAPSAPASGSATP